MSLVGVAEIIDLRVVIGRLGKAGGERVKGLMRRSGAGRPPGLRALDRASQTHPLPGGGVAAGEGSASQLASRGNRRVVGESGSAV